MSWAAIAAAGPWEATGGELLVGMVLFVGLPVLIAFFIGGVNPASILARVLGRDLSAEGSGNPGATNAGRVMGVRWGVVVGVLDVLKGWLPTAFVARSGLGTAIAELVAVALVLGHVFSPYLRGRGGKGVATTLGTVLALQPWWALWLLLAFGVAVLILRTVGAGSMVAAVVLIGLGISAYRGGAGVTTTGWAVLVGLAVLARHGSNIRALLRRGR